jgi:hypothetical protein
VHVGESGVVAEEGESAGAKGPARCLATMISATPMSGESVAERFGGRTVSGGVRAPNVSDVGKPENSAKAKPIDAMAQLARDGAKRQQLLVLRDIAPVTLAALVLMYLLPLGGAIVLGLLSILVVLFTILLQTSPARLRKIFYSPESLRNVIIARNGRRNMARVWVICAPNRSLILALHTRDVDTFVSALKIETSRVRPQLFDDDASARAAYSAAMKK